MSLFSGIAGFAVAGVARLFPGAAPIISAAIAIEPYAAEVLPAVASALKEGPAAFAAAKAQAPEFFRHLGDLAALLKGGAELPPKFATKPPSKVEADDHELAVLAAHIVGVDPPGWTHENTQAWWDRVDGGR